MKRYTTWLRLPAVAGLMMFTVHTASVEAHASPHAGLPAVADTFDLARNHPPGSGTLRLEISRSERELRST